MSDPAKKKNGIFFAKKRKQLFLAKTLFLLDWCKFV